MTELLRYLRDDVEAFGSSGTGTVTNHVAGFELFNRVRETVDDLLRARDRAVDSASAAAQLDPRADASGVLVCINLISQLVPDLQALSAEATRCFLSVYYPDV